MLQKHLNIVAVGGAEEDEHGNPDLDIIVFDVFKDPVGEVDVGGALHTPHVYLVGNENSVLVPYYIGFWGDLWCFGV